MQAGEALGADGEINSVLETIADDVHRCSAAARAQTMTEFAAAVAHTLRHLPRHARAAALAAIAHARKAALALLKQNAARELAGRKKAAIAARRKSRRRPGTTQSKQPRHYAAPSTR